MNIIKDAGWKGGRHSLSVNKMLNKIVVR